MLEHSMERPPHRTSRQPDSLTATSDALSQNIKLGQGRQPWTSESLFCETDPSRTSSGKNATLQTDFQPGLLICILLEDVRPTYQPTFDAIVPVNRALKLGVPLCIGCYGARASAGVG